MKHSFSLPVTGFPPRDFLSLPAVGSNSGFVQACPRLAALGRWANALPASWMAVAMLVFGAWQAQGQTVTTFSTAGNTTWTCPTGTTSVQVEAWGGGGAGGSYVRYTVSVSPGSYNLTIGSGGSGGTGGAANTAGNGGAGGSSYFGNSTAGNPSDASALAVGGAGGTLNHVAGTSSSYSGNVAGGTGSNSGNIPSSGAAANIAGSNGGTPSTGTKASGAGGTGAGGGGAGGGGSNQCRQWQNGDPTRRWWQRRSPSYEYC